MLVSISYCNILMLTPNEATETDIKRSGEKALETIYLNDLSIVSSRVLSTHAPTRSSYIPNYPDQNRSEDSKLPSFPVSLFPAPSCPAEWSLNHERSLKKRKLNQTLSWAASLC